MFALTEFLVEAVLREKLEELKESDDLDLILIDVFGRLKDQRLAVKYGVEELEKIKQFILKGEIQIHQALTTLAKETSLPAFSIHLQSDHEDESKASLDDYEGECEVPVDPEIVVDLFDADSFESPPAGGTRVRVPSTTDLSGVYRNLLFTDGNGLSHKIIDPINNDASYDGGKYITIDPDLPTLNLSSVSIVSSINVRIFELKYIPSKESIMIGAHAENALLTKYLYYLLKWMLFTGKEIFKRNGLELSSHVGSDFNLSKQFIAESVFSRFVTHTSVHYDYFRGAEKTIIEAIQPYAGGGDNQITISDCFLPTAYDDMTGIITVPDSVDLSKVKIDDIFRLDLDGTRIKILSGINDTPGVKQFRVESGLGLTFTIGECWLITRLYSLKVERDGSDREDGNELTWTTTEDDES